MERGTDQSGVLALEYLGTTCQAGQILSNRTFCNFPAKEQDEIQILSRLTKNYYSQNRL